MKLLHTADLHIDSPLTTHLDARRIRERKNELAMNLDRLIKAAISERADGIIIAGDLFDSQTPSRGALERVLYAISRAGVIKFFYLCGNHEKNAIIASGIPIPENLFIFGEAWTYFPLGNTVLAGRTTTSEDMFDTLDARSGNLIVVLHGTLGDKCSPGGCIGRREAGECGARYIALGHYHSYSKEQLSPFCEAVYCGAPEGRGFDETGKKGYVVLEVTDSKIQHKFVEFAKRSLHIIDVNITGATKSYEVDDRISKAIGAIPHSDLVRVRLTGRRAPTLLDDLDGYIDRHKDGYYYFELTDATVLGINKENYLNDKSIVGRFICRVMDSEELSDTDKQLIIECGLSAMGIGI